MKKRNKEYLQSAVITGKEAPKNPYPEKNSLKEALLWTVATGVLASVTKVLLRYTFTAGTEKAIEN